MATEVHKQEFRIRDLPTRSVILFPSQAQIIRDIASITLKPGANKIVITGISPTVDENSIKVEGTGAATITEVSHDLLPNREIYEEIYPSDDEDEDETSSSDESDEEIDEMKELNAKIKEAQNKLAAHQESINSGTNRLQICDNFGQSVRDARPPPEDLKNLLGTYENERFQIFQDHQKHTTAIEDIQEDITKLEKKKTKLAKELVKANEKKEKEKVKLEQQRLRKKAEIAKEKARIKAERESFWPKKVYNITISIEPASALTPASSRRSSVDGDTIVNLATTDFHKPGKEELKGDEISLSLSYITFSASWSPRYDLALNTVKSVGSLDYGAELRNTTSETWKDCKVVLSTSQTSFSGLSETIPVLQPWHVRLQKGKNHDSALYSHKELTAKRAGHSRSTGTASQKPRGEIFGREGSSAPVVKYNRDSRNRQVQHVLNQNSVPAQTFSFGANSSAVPPPPMAASAFGAPHYEAARGGGLFGSSVMMARKSAPGGRADEHEEEEKIDYSDEDMGYGLFDGPSPDAAKALVFEEGSWEESGMTTTYDVPGSRTLAPSNSTVKHKIAKVDFRNVVFSHIIIGKLRQVAFLKARLRNTSKISLLKGPLGLTLDGSFLGRATFPRVSSGESFTLPLGVDPAINVAYPKATVQRSQSGIFSKEDSNVFTRTLIITNTKHTGPVELTVLDQIPVSEDERLKIEIVTPKGLRIGGDGVKAGQSSTQPPAVTGNAATARASAYGVDAGGSSNTGKWGSAVATAKKGGEVSWNVKLNAGQGVKLVLEYETAFPSGESVVGVEQASHSGLYD